MFFIFFILGLIIGSFLNVVISRLRTAETILGHSKCPHCQARIRWYDNVPLFSFVILGTRCRDCKEKISWQYPAVEFSTGLLFGLIGNYFFSASNPETWITALFYMIIISALVVIFAYDSKYMEIPMIMIWIGIVAAVAYYLFYDWANFDKALGIFSLNLFSGTLAGAAAFIFFFLLSAGSREKWMGIGDAYVALFVGLVIKWPNIWLALVIAFTLGAIYGIILIILGKKSLKSQVPFAPFMIAGALLMLFIPQIFPAVKYWFIYF